MRIILDSETFFRHFYVAPEKLELFPDSRKLLCTLIQKSFTIIYCYGKNLPLKTNVSQPIYLQ